MRWAGPQHLPRARGPPGPQPLGVELVRGLGPAGAACQRLARLVGPRLADIARRAGAGAPALLVHRTTDEEMPAPDGWDTITSPDVTASSRFT